MSTQDPSDEAAESLGVQPQSVAGSQAGSSVAGSGRGGVLALVAVAVAYLMLWVLARPGGQPLGRFVGEIRGAAERHPSLRVHVVRADTDGSIGG